MYLPYCWYYKHTHKNLHDMSILMYIYIYYVYVYHFIHQWIDLDVAACFEHLHSSSKWEPAG